MTDIEVREDDDGGTATADIGDRIVIRLAENGSTGYQWCVGEVGSTMDIESNDLMLPPSPGPGAEGQRVVILRARATGRGRVVLTLKRSWESQPIRVFTVEVNTRGR